MNILLLLLRIFTWGQFTFFKCNSSHFLGNPWQLWTREGLNFMHLLNITSAANKIYQTEMFSSMLCWSVSRKLKEIWPMKISYSIYQKLRWYSNHILIKESKTKVPMIHREGRTRQGNNLIARALFSNLM